MKTKTCSKCREEKPLDQFYRQKNSKDGRRPDCKTCGAATKRKYREGNTSYKLRQREWAEANREQLAERQRAWLEVDPDYYRRYRESNPHVGWTASYRKRCRRFGIDPVVEDFTKADVIEMWGDSCFYCAGPFEELDHWIPVSQGSPHTLAAVRPSCVTCNRVKHDKPGDEWEAEQERLDNLTPEELNAEIDAEIARWSTP